MTTIPPPEDVARRASARRIIRTSVIAALATIDADSRAPYASLVSVATAMDGTPLALMSQLAQHWRNVETDARASLLLDATAEHEDRLAGARVSLMGRASKTESDADRRRFRAVHPSAFYADFADFSLFRITPERTHLIAGFGRVEWIEGTEILLDEATLGSLASSEADIVAHMNRDHADAISLYATMLLGADPAPWEMTGIDPEGIDLAAGRKRLRLDFAEPVCDASAARAALVGLVREARARGDA